MAEPLRYHPQSHALQQQFDQHAGQAPIPERVASVVWCGPYCPWAIYFSYQETSRLDSGCFKRKFA